MRRPLLSSLLLACGLVLLNAATGEAQFRPGGFGGRFDPGTLFDKYAQGKPYILIAEYPPERREPLLQFAKERGITDGKLTREQFVAYIDERMKSFGRGGPRGMGTPGPAPGARPFGTPGTTPGTPTTPGGGPPSADKIGEIAELDFKRRDANGDGKLNADEMPDALKTDLVAWDKNRDSLIESAEYKDYFTARIQGTGGSASQSAAPAPNPVAAIIIEEEDLDRRPVVYRAGKLPKELPAWFKELDTDEDGQVALYEWRGGGKALDEFRPWDRNDDGYVTIDEALRQQGVARNGASAARPTTGPAAAAGGESREGRGRGFGGRRRGGQD